MSSIQQIGAGPCGFRAPGFRARGRSGSRFCRRMGAILTRYTGRAGEVNGKKNINDVFPTDPSSHLYYLTSNSSTSKVNWPAGATRSEEHTSELQSRENIVCLFHLVPDTRVFHTFPTRRSSDLGRSGSRFCRRMGAILTRYTGRAGEVNGKKNINDVFPTDPSSHLYYSTSNSSSSKVNGPAGAP